MLYVYSEYGRYCVLLFGRKVENSISVLDKKKFLFYVVLFGWSLLGCCCVSVLGMGGGFIFAGSVFWFGFILVRVFVGSG